MMIGPILGHKSPSHQLRFSVCQLRPETAASYWRATWTHNDQEGHCSKLFGHVVAHTTSCRRHQRNNIATAKHFNDAKLPAVALFPFLSRNTVNQLTNQLKIQGQMTLHLDWAGSLASRITRR
jgi:hypothetical protein